MKVMIQVSHPDRIKDPSAAYTSCIEQDFDECVKTINRVRYGPEGLIFTRAFILHDDGTESHHCEK